MTFVCVVEAEIHLGGVHDLKGKRKVVKSLKDRLRRFGAAVSETAGHDKWQRATLVCALVGDSRLGDRADELERLIESGCLGDCSFRRDLLSLEDIRG